MPIGGILSAFQAATGNWWDALHSAVLVGFVTLATVEGFIRLSSSPTCAVLGFDNITISVPSGDLSRATTCCSNRNTPVAYQSLSALGVVLLMLLPVILNRLVFAKQLARFPAVVRDIYADKSEHDKPASPPPAPAWYTKKQQRYEDAVTDFCDNVVATNFPGRILSVTLMVLFECVAALVCSLYFVIDSTTSHQISDLMSFGCYDRTCTNALLANFPNTTSIVCDIKRESVSVMYVGLIFAIFSTASTVMRITSLWHGYKVVNSIVQRRNGAIIWPTNAAGDQMRVVYNAANRHFFYSASASLQLAVWMIGDGLSGGWNTFLRSAASRSIEYTLVFMADTNNARPNHFTDADIAAVQRWRRNLPSRVTLDYILAKCFN